MKWTFIIQQKVKIAFLMASIMLLITITNLMERKNMQNMNRYFSSIYYDRLIPATDIFYLTEHLYNKRLLLENFLYTGNAASTDFIEKQLRHNTLAINKLIDKFSMTYLVKNEVIALEDFKETIKSYNAVEADVLKISSIQSKADAQKLYEREGKKDMLRTLQYLRELTSIQSSVGLDLFHDSKSVISSSNLLLTLQISIAIVIGLLIQGLVMASKMVNTKQNKLNLN